MKSIHRSLRGLGLVAMALVILSLIMPTVIAAKGDWFIYINSAYVPRGSSCLSVVTGDDDHVTGRLDWEDGSDPGFSWYYSYDDTHWYAASYQWFLKAYFFDFYANDHGYDWGDYFKIQSFDSNPPPYYYCSI